MSGQRTQEWVEIIEPTSREKMFANPVSGEILFTPPEGAVVKPMSDHQWWELYDQSTDRYYYYNAVTGDTIWNKPEEGADIISLTKLQSSTSASGSQPVSPTLDPVPEETPPQEESSTSASGSQPVSPTLDPVPEETPPQEEVVQNRSRVEMSNSPIEVAVNGDPNRKLSEMLLQDLEPMSPLKVDFPELGFGALKDLSTTTVDERIGQTTTAEVSTSGSNVEMRQAVCKQELDESDVRYQEHRYKDQERESWVDIKLVKGGPSGGRASADSTLIDGGHRGVIPGGVKANDKGAFGGSLDRTNRGRDKLRSGTFESHTLEHRGSKRGAPVRPAPGIPGKGSSHSASSTPTHATPANNQTDSVPGVVPVAPAFNPPVRRHTTSPGKPTGTSLESFGDLVQHRKGLFRKKVTIANMLCWTKEPIKQPMIQTRDKQLRKEGVDLFKLLLQYMGDKKTKFKNPSLLALEITTRAWEKKGLRDEIYIQLCRQTSGNEKPKSLERGWELIAICLAFFPPSIRFRSYLEGYLWRHVEPLPANKGIPVEMYAQYCHRKIEKMARSGAKKGLKKPNIEEVVHAKRAPFNPSMFGTSLEEVIELQKDKFPDCKMPWVVQALVDAVMQLQGPSTEGIFRVPGDIDEVNGLKLQMDKGLLPMDKLRDPHVPASLLKLWFRELEDPLIPEEYYQECIDNCDDEVNAISLIQSLPDANRELLLYLVDFLKQFVNPENIEKTKMGLENIAMVWAPNFLRCPSDDHTLIFQNTRKEMSFLRILLKFLDTDI